MRAAISVPAGIEEEPLADDGGEVVGALVRSWRSLDGTVEVGAEPVREGLFGVTVKIMNTAPWSGRTGRRRSSKRSSRRTRSWRWREESSSRSWTRRRN